MNPQGKKVAWVLKMLVALLIVSHSRADPGFFEEADMDPVQFSMSASKHTVVPGEEVEINIDCRIRSNLDDRLYFTVLDTDFRLKLVFPDGFLQTGGDYRDFIGERLSAAKSHIVYKVRGKFSRVPESGTFQLLRGTSESVEIGRFLARGELTIVVHDPLYVASPGNARVAAFSLCLESEAMASANGPVTSDPNASGGKTRGAENQYNHYVDYTLTGVPSTGSYQVTLRYYSSANPVINVQVNSSGSQSITLPNSNSWNITYSDYTFNVTLSAGNNTLRIQGTGGGSCRQDRICVSGSGSPCVTPAAPTISKTSGTTVCAATNQTITLTASAFTGTVNWFRNGSQVSTGASITQSEAGNYTATCTKDGCTSATSSTILISQSANCGANFSQCLEAESMASATGAVSNDPNASNGQTRGAENQYNHYVDYAVTNVPATGSYQIKLRYYSSIPPNMSLSVNGANAQNVTLPNSGSWNIAYADYTFTANLSAGNNTVRIGGTGGGSCRQDRICVTGSATPCNVLAAPTISKTAGTTVCATVDQTVTLTATAYSGTVTWSKDGSQVATGVSYITSTAGTYSATYTADGCVSAVSGTVSVTQTAGCGANSLSPKISSSGFPEVLTLSIVSDPSQSGSWLISDVGTVSLPAGYEWSYFVGNKWIKRSSNLLNEPWQTNSPGRVVKMATKIGLDTLNRWPCPNEGCGYYYQADAVAQLVPGARGGLTTFIFN